MPWAIATSGLVITARSSLDMLALPPDTPLITRDQVRHAKPDPDLFLPAADLIGADVQNSFVIGDSIWDLLVARRAATLGIGLGYGRDEPTASTPTPPTCSSTFGVRCSPRLSGDFQQYSVTRRRYP